MDLEHPIETERLIIRRFVPEDWPDLHAYLSDKRVVCWAPYDVYSEQDSRDAAARKAKSKESLAVCLKTSGKVIGNLYLGIREYETLELGFQFNADYWHQGYATESARAVITEAFVSGVAWRIMSRCNPENEASWRLMERLGMRREGHLRQSIYFQLDAEQQPLWEDTYIYAILRAEWPDVQSSHQPST